MGAEFQIRGIQFEDKESVSAQYAEYIDALTIEFGTNIYSGQLCTLGKQIEFTNESFSDLEDAAEWIETHHQKWENPLAVKTSVGWLIGGWCPC